MKRTLVLIVVVALAIALFAWLVHLVLVATHVSEPAVTTVNGLTNRRLWASTVVVLALIAAVIGGLALVRAGRFRAAGRFGIVQRGAVVAVVAGLIAAVNGGLLLSVATGGPGSGNGVVGAAGALVLGLIGISLGGLALARVRRSHSTG
jgi:uncharacterized protein DUF6223